MPLDAVVAVLGLLVGLVLALTGAGGGAIAVPLLIFATGLPIQQLAPAALVAVAASAAIGTALAWREGLVRYRAAAWIGFAGMLAAPVGVALAGQLPQAPLLLAFAAFLVLTAWRAWRPPVTRETSPAVACPRSAGSHRLRWTTACAARLGGTGATAGLLSGLLGVGGGFVVVPSLERRTDLELRSIQATSLAVIALVSMGGIGAAIWQGQLTASVAVPFGLGSIAGLLAGRRLGRGLRPSALRSAFGLLALAAAVLLFAKGAMGVLGG